MRGSKVLELGAGVGLAGMAAALLGPASVTLTDTVELIPLLQRNVDRNLSSESIKSLEGALCYTYNPILFVSILPSVVCACVNLAPPCAFGFSQHDSRCHDTDCQARPSPCYCSSRSSGQDVPMAMQVT